MKNIFALFAAASALGAVACDISAPQKQGPVHPGSEQTPPRSSGNAGSQISCEDRGLVTNSSGECESPRQSCEDQGKVSDANGNCVEKPAAQQTCEDQGKVTASDGTCTAAPAPQKTCEEQGKVTGVDGACIDKPNAPAGGAAPEASGSGSSGSGSSGSGSSGSGSSGSARATEPTTKLVTLTATQNTFLVSLDAAKQNCFVAKDAKIVIDSNASKEFAPNPVQTSAKLTTAAGTCAVGEWNYFNAHFK